MNDSSAPSTSSLPAVSLFSNCGAGDLGYAQAGFSFEVLAELERMRLDVAALNHPNAEPVHGDLRDTWRAVVAAYRRRQGDVAPALLAACPPCQGMSSARSGRGRADDADAGSRDERNLLVQVIARVTHALKPRIVVVENVTAFLSRQVRHPDTDVPVSAAVLLARSLRQRYVLYALTCDLAEYGIPQTRKRTFLTFVRRDVPSLEDLRRHARAPFPRPTHARDGGGQLGPTLRQALASLAAPPLDARDPSRAGAGMHAVPVWKGRRYHLVASIPPYGGQGAWANSVCPNCGDVEVQDSAAACPHCAGPLARPVVEENGTLRLVRGFRSSSYTRMRPDEPAATVTTASGSMGSDKTLHPWENRVLSPLECAHLQTFPPDFRWGEALERWGSTNVRAMIGEAVPPQFTRLHGEVLAGLLGAPSTAPPIARSDRRVMRAHTALKTAEAAFLARRAQR